MIKARRVIDIFDDDGNGEVDFKEFIMGLSHFRFKAKYIAKTTSYRVLFFNCSHPKISKYKKKNKVSEIMN